jgi:hypothetical protein
VAQIWGERRKRRRRRKGERMTTEKGPLLSSLSLFLLSIRVLVSVSRDFRIPLIATWTSSMQLWNAVQVPRGTFAACNVMSMNFSLIHLLSLSFSLSLFLSLFLFLYLSLSFAKGIILLSHVAVYNLC